MSWQIFLGPPVVLYAKSLGASATMLGIIVSLTPLLTVFQIPAARLLPRFGYRRFFLAGWGMRNLCVFGVSCIPMLGFLDKGPKLALLVAFQVTFNFLRGISSGAWMPWITELLPDESRARYLWREQRFVQVGCLVSLLFSGFVFQKNSTPLQFSLVFLLSAVGGALSLVFLNKIPDVPPHRLKMSGTRVPWREIILFPPFVRLIGFNLLYLFASGSMGVFTVSFLKGRASLGENQILLCIAASTVASLTSLRIAGEMLDRIGSKCLLRLALTLFLFCIAGWASLAGGLLRPTLAAILSIYIVGGIAASAIALANVRLQMSTMPEMGRSHFFAFFTVISSLSLGLTPIIWGVCIDAMSGFKYVAGPFEWNRYSTYFVAVLLSMCATLAATAVLIEKRTRHAANSRSLSEARSCVS